MSIPPAWIYYMLAGCLASFLIGWIIAWAMDQWQNK
jgi:hypothetical protein